MFVYWEILYSSLRRYFPLLILGSLCMLKIISTILRKIFWIFKEETTLVCLPAKPSCVLLLSLALTSLFVHKPIFVLTFRKEQPNLSFCKFLVLFDNWGPELFVSPSMSTAQTRPVYSTARSGGSLSSVYPFISGYSSFVNPMASFDSNLVSSNSGLLHTESSVVNDLSIRSTTQSIFPLQMDWCGPPGSSTSYMAPVQSNLISISSSPHSDIQRFFQDFKLQIIH